MKANLEEILSHFRLEGSVQSVEPFGNGLINDTFLVRTTGPSYVLQRINHNIFKDVDLLQGNIEAVTAHLRGKLEKEGVPDIERKVLMFVPLKDSERTYYKCGEGDEVSYWRVSVFIKDSVTFDLVDEKYCLFAGKAFGQFEANLADLPVQLGETIPHFHDMELRLRQLDDAVRDGIQERVAEGEVQELLSQIEEDRFEMTLAERANRDGRLQKRVCHCDTKVNNMLFSKEGDVLCVIDLDTVMPSYVFSDFGDFLRTAACSTAEDEPDTSKIHFRMDIFKAFAKGYIEGTKSFLTPTEKDLLPYAALLFPFMQAVRFLTDYLVGDTYYKISYPTHNLVRARAQMALYQSARSHRDEMKEIISKL